MDVFRAKNGFTLLELLMSMVILAIAFVGIVPFFFYSQSQIKQAIITNYAMNLIQEKMDRITQLNYDQIIYDDQDGTPNEYIFILPEVRMAPCTTLPPGNCGFIPTPVNMLRDYVERDGYFFTRIIDIDQPDERNSLEPEDRIGTGNNLPPDQITKRITIKVSWTVPGGKTQFVTSTTHVADIDLPEFLN